MKVYNFSCLVFYEKQPNGEIAVIDMRQD